MVRQGWRFSTPCCSTNMNTYRTVGKEKMMAKVMGTAEANSEGAGTKDSSMECLSAQCPRQERHQLTEPRTKAARH
jgi:hypothetical protein